MFRRHISMSESLLLVLASCCCCIIDFGLAANQAVTDCEHHNGHLNNKLDAFFTHYETRLRHDSQRHRCQKFAAVQTYLQKMTSSKCPTPFDSTSGLRHWMALVDEMNCTCGGQSTACATNEICFHDEIHGFWTSRCDEVHQYNRQQPTKHQCLHTEENIYCKLVLVRSACGNKTGILANSILRLRSLMSSPACARNGRRNSNIPADNMFEYSENCTKTFVAEFDQCVATHLTRSDVVKFDDKNELIVAEKHHQSMQPSCTALRSFRRCIVPLETSCKHGVSMVLNHQIDLHKYLLKMDFICKNRTLPVYTSSLKCYQDVVSGGQLGQCNSLWFDLRSALDNITSHQFYCQRGHRGRHHVLRHIESLTLCHGLQFARQCGRNSSRVLTDLMTLALKDHVYLRFRYRPRCAEVHSTTTKTTTTTTTTTTTSPMTTTISVTATPSVTPTKTAATSTTVVMTTDASTLSTIITTSSTAKRFRSSNVVPSTEAVEVETTATSSGITSSAAESSSVSNRDETSERPSMTSARGHDVDSLTDRATSYLGVKNVQFVQAVIASLLSHLYTCQMSCLT